jgi:hypothetical protein
VKGYRENCEHECNDSETIDLHGLSPLQTGEQMQRHQL